MNRPRWSVAVLDGDLRSREILTETIRSAGGVVTQMPDRLEEAVSLVSRVKPDVTVLAAGGNDGNEIEVAEMLTTAASCPVVLLASELDERATCRVSTAGVMGVLMRPLRPAALPPTLDLAIARFKDLDRLREQLADRKVIERAKGLLMERTGVSESQAFQLLRRTAMNRRLRMAQIARSVIVAESSWDGRFSLLDEPGMRRASVAAAGVRRDADG